MGLITGEIKHPTIKNVEIVIDEKSKSEMRSNWNILSLDTDFATIRTPNDLIALGEWLCIQGELIKKQYTPTGKRRTQVELLEANGYVITADKVEKKDCEY